MEQREHPNTDTAQRLAVGGLSIGFSDGDPSGIRFFGTEVVKRLSCLVRDENWGTVPVRSLSETVGETGSGIEWDRRFVAMDGSFDGAFALDAAVSGSDATISVRLKIRAARDLTINRAGLTVLHPLAGARGARLEVTHPQGRKTVATLPALVSPESPAVDIVGLAHTVDGIDVDIRFEGEIFEMEDQRNWSDASYKTFCRPLALPVPYIVRAGETIEQTATIGLTRTSEDPGTTSATMPTLPRRAVAPRQVWSATAGVTSPEVFQSLPGLAIALRLPPDSDDEYLSPYAELPVARLEIVLADDDDGTASLPQLNSIIQAQGLRPEQVIALPASYLKAEDARPGKAPVTTPRALIDHLRAAFPGCLVGGGALTHFSEFNACPPEPDNVDFVTFGNSAIVHVADDASVMETLIALPDIFATTRAAAPGLPLHLGLFSIAMRENPYGADLVANPQDQRVPMAGNDPRQHLSFAAAYGLAVFALAAEAGVASIALAMPDGPLGVMANGGLSPLGRLIDVLSAWADAEISIERPARSVIRVTCGQDWVAANLSSSPVSDPIAIEPFAVAYPAGKTWIHIKQPRGTACSTPQIPPASVFSESPPTR